MGSTAVPVGFLGYCTGCTATASEISDYSTSQPATTVTVGRFFCDGHAGRECTTRDDELCGRASGKGYEASCVAAGRDDAWTTLSRRRLTNGGPTVILSITASGTSCSPVSAAWALSQSKGCLASGRASSGPYVRARRMPTASLGINTPTPVFLSLRHRIVLPPSLRMSPRFLCSNSMRIPPAVTHLASSVRVTIPRNRGPYFARQSLQNNMQIRFRALYMIKALSRRLDSFGAQWTERRHITHIGWTCHIGSHSTNTQTMRWAPLLDGSDERTDFLGDGCTVKEDSKRCGMRQPDSAPFSLTLRGLLQRSTSEKLSEAASVLCQQGSDSDLVGSAPRDSHASHRRTLQRGPRKSGDRPDALLSSDLRKIPYPVPID
ncbi:uncharacterized protein C8Q71DRAFT_851343, partial [Rhodofomes roseus]